MTYLQYCQFLKENMVNLTNSILKRYFELNSQKTVFDQVDIESFNISKMELSRLMTTEERIRKAIGIGIIKENDNVGERDQW